MKHHLLRSAVLVLALSANVYGGECNMEIRDGSLAQDLTRAFQCFDQRLKNLESKFSDPEQRVGNSTPVRNPGAFDAGAFTVSVHTASRQGKTLYVGIQIHNRTTEQISLALNETFYQGGGLSLIDEVTGIPVPFSGDYTVGIIRQYGNIYSNEEKDFTLIPPNARLNFTLQFSSEHAKSDMLSLTLHLFSLKNRQIQRITAPLSVTLRGR